MPHHHTHTSSTNRTGAIGSALLVFALIAGVLVGGYLWFNKGGSERTYDRVHVTPSSRSILPDRRSWSPDHGLQQPSNNDAVRANDR